MKTNLLIADDNPMLCESFKNLAAKYDFIHVVGTVNNGENLIQEYFRLLPDIVVMDISISKKSGFDAFKEIIKRDKCISALFYSFCENKKEIFEIYKAGAKGYISKNREPKKIIEAIRVIKTGNIFFDEEFSLSDFIRYNDSINEKNSLKEKKISKRELDVLVLVAQGLTNKKVALKLNISERTVEFHRRNIRQKFGLIGSSGLVKFAIKKVNTQ